MFHRLLSLILISCAFTSVAQITITNSHMPKSGDTIRYSTATTLGNTAVTKTGANVTWDFSDLSPVSQGVEAYKASYLTPYIINFGFTAIGMQLLDTLGTADFQLKNVYNFYRNSTSSFNDVGIGFQFGAFPLPQSGKHSDPDEIYTFPLKYSDRDSTTFDLTVPIMLSVVPVGSFFRKGSRINEVDGWGKITTPYGKDIACIRLKSTITEFDSISVSVAGIGFGTTITRTEYKWLSTTERIPILFVSGNEIAGRFVPTNIRYRDSVRVIGPPNNGSVDFTVDKRTANKEVVLSFTNLSEGNNLRYNWSITPSSAVMFVNGTSTTSEHPRVIFSDTGWYSVKLVAGGFRGIDSTTKVNFIHITNSLGLGGLTSAKLNVYPNPAQGSITVEGLSSYENAEVVITDQTGRLVSALRLGERRDINISGLALGSYILSIFDDANNLIHRQVLITGD